MQRSKFIEVYTNLKKNILPANAETRKIVKEAGGKIWEGGYPAHTGDWEHGIVYPDIQEMSKELKLAESSIQKYLKAFCDAGILKPLPKRILLGGSIVYAIEERRGWKNPKTGESGSRVVPYLKNDKKIKKGLAEFKL